jgi:hypothetical protein
LSAEEILSPEEYKQFKEFELYFSTLEGKTDIKSRLMLLLNPDMPITTAFLSKGQAHFVAIAHFMAQKWKEFQGLEDFANQVCLSTLGVEGKGIDASVRLTGAVVESKLLQRLGIGVSQKEESEKK